MKVHLSITTRLALIFVLFAAVLLGGLGALAYTSGRAGLQEAATSELLTRAIEKQAALENWISVARNNIAIQAESPVIVEQAAILLSAAPGSPQAQAEHDRLVREFQPHTGSETRFTELFFIEAESGQALAATDPDEEGKFKENMPFFIQGKSKPYVSEMYYSVTLGRPAMTAAAPVISDDGRLLGVLAGRLNLDVLDTLINRRTGLRQTDDAFLTNSIGLLVTQPRFIPDPGILQKTLKTEAVNRCLDGNSGVISADDYRGVPVLISYRWLPERQICLIVTIDQAEAFAPSLAFSRTIVLTGGLALVSAIILAIVLARTFMRPILALQTGAKRLGQGDLEYRVEVKSQDEIGRLSTAFNEMAASLEKQITERVRAEQALQAYTAKLEQSNRDLQEFAYVASHDLQEPLRKVQAFSDRLATKYTDALDDTGRDYLKRMRDASQRMQILINDLLGFSRISTRAQPFTEVDLNTIAREVISDLQNRIERTQARVEIGDLPTLEADPTQMRQILQNLIGNALKFHHEKRSPLIKVSAKIEEDTCVISVEDNGIGFDT
ncbi:MAG: HAMP domain-containing protein, partial [Anaerolineales bacterium]|nr:HAMP domain-containing protein [Anaerolineales bacterium]